MAGRKGKRRSWKDWQGHIDSWRSSGLSQAEYCRKHDLHPKIFGNWKRKLSAPREDGFVEVRLPAERPSTEPLFELRYDRDGRLGLRFDLDLPGLLGALRR